MFRVGQKVVCVNHRGSAYGHKKTPVAAILPDIGGIYTIRAIITRPLATIVLLEEISNTHLGYAVEPGFNAAAFRPAVERKTDISIFTRMLTPKTEEVL